jgi:hypothetical protein
MKENELLQIQADLVGKKCQVFIFGEGIITNIVSEVTEITYDDLLRPFLAITLKNGKTKKDRPVIRIHEPFRYTREQDSKALRYKFHTFDKLTLLIGFTKEEGTL